MPERENGHVLHVNALTLSTSPSFSAFLFFLALTVPVPTPSPVSQNNSPGTDTQREKNILRDTRKEPFFSCWVG